MADSFKSTAAQREGQPTHPPLQCLIRTIFVRGDKVTLPDQATTFEVKTYLTQPSKMWIFTALASSVLSAFGFGPLGPIASAFSS